MKRSFIAILILALFMLSLCGCAHIREEYESMMIRLLESIMGPLGAGNDWCYILPNHYVIDKIHSSKIVLNKYVGEGGCEHVLDKFALEFCYSTTHVGLKCTELSMDIDIETDVDDPEYYFLDTESKELAGPLTKIEYDGIIAKLEDVQFSRWYNTTPPDWENFTFDRSEEFVWDQ